MKWQPTSVFLFEKSPGQRSLVGDSPWGHKELNMTEQLKYENMKYGCAKWYPNCSVGALILSESDFSQP